MARRGSFSLGGLAVTVLCLVVLASLLAISASNSCVFVLLRTLFNSTPNMLRDLWSAGLVALLLSARSEATLLYVSSYGGTVTTLNLTLASGGAASLTEVSSTDGCPGNPSWLTLDYPNAVLYCIEEGFNTKNATIASFKTVDDGSLKLLGKINTIGGPVSGVIYGDGGRGLAVAH